jgi:O-acetylhomoserine (thiol)-lyase
VAKEVGVPFLVDNTVATPYLLNPLKHGVDTVIHSATKYIGGHGTAIAGVVIDGGTFDYGAHGDKFPGFTTPDDSYHGLVFAEALGPAAFIAKLRVQYLRNVGPAISPFNAFLIAQGLETLSLRVERHVENTRKVAEWLSAREDVSKVTWASLDGNPYKELADKYVPRGSGAVLTFELPGGIDAGRRFIDALELFSHVANIGDVRSLAIHPASTTHSQGTPEEHAATGVTPGLVRLAVGLEGIDDILADLEAGLRAAK